MGMLGTKWGHRYFSNTSRNYFKSTKISLEKELYPIIGEKNIKNIAADVAILGGGVVGSALMYLLSKHTCLKKLVFISENGSDGEINLPFHLDETIHSGEVEPAVDLQHSLKLSRHADSLRGFLLRLPSESGMKCMRKTGKMLVGVGEEEGARIEKRYEEFRHFFPKIKLVGKNEIKVLEPSIGYLDTSGKKLRKETINGIFAENEYMSIDYGLFSKVLMELVQGLLQTKKGDYCRIPGANDVTAIQRVYSEGEIYFRIGIGNSNIYSRFLVINDVGNALNFVKRLGYCSNWGVVNLVGKLQITQAPKLKGIVYCFNNKNIPFITSHAYTRMSSGGETRFLTNFQLETTGEKSLIPSELLKLLERNKRAPIYLNGKLRENKLGIRNKIDISLLTKNKLFSMYSKLIPSLERSEMKRFDTHQINSNSLVDFSRNRFISESHKIHTDENLILNSAHIISGTTCIRNASEDMITICNKLGVNVNEKSLKKEIPEYEVYGDTMLS
ncbi:putative malate:quinone oxidoreductase [Cryptosporidium felis]|nr:putative malate:quinone oxidoreductase [Cryptosporidium felis]